MDDFSDELKGKLSELKIRGIDINVLLLELLQKREREIEEEREKLRKSEVVKTSRYIPAKTRNLIKKEHGNKCSMPECQREARVIHHKLPFALGHSHDPSFLAPLCSEHHKIAHLINVKYAEMRR